MILAVAVGVVAPYVYTALETLGEFDPATPMLNDGNCQHVTG